MTDPAVPELDGEILLTDSGVETDLIFNQGVELPLFACFVLADDPVHRDRLVEWHRQHAETALEHGLGVSLDSATWRASADWGALLGYDVRDLDRVNRDLVAMLHAVRAGLPAGAGPVRVGGTLGPRSDGYHPTLVMNAEEAEEYHAPQLRSFVAAGAERATALTLGYVDEAVGIVAAASDLDLPVLVGFTVETDGRLPDGTPLGDAITAVDARTGVAAAGFLVNCAHPDHLAAALPPVGDARRDEGAGADWVRRLVGFRPNASRRSHAELDAAADLDAGDPIELGRQVAELRRAYPSVNLVGGCCGTDLRHARAIAAAVAAG